LSDSRSVGLPNGLGEIALVGVAAASRPSSFEDMKSEQRSALMHSSQQIARDRTVYV
jgi:hypothetical protein